MNLNEENMGTVDLILTALNFVSDLAIIFLYIYLLPKLLRHTNKIKEE